MTPLQTLLHLTNFQGQSPLLSTIVPSVSAAFAIQAACAAPSIAFRSDRFYDLSGAATYVAVSAFSLWLPSLRAKYGYLPLSGGGGGGGMVFHWRQVVLCGAVGIWAVRLGSYLFRRILQDGSDSRFDKIKTNPKRFFVAFMIQATWVSLCLMPVMAVNAIPAAAASAVVAGSKVKLTDVLGLSMYLGGLTLEVVADRQKARWVQERREKVHDEQFLTRGLWSRSRHPNYFGESTLWLGIATTSVGVLLSRPVRAALGLSAASAVALCYVSPAFVTFLLLRVSGVPLSERKYDAKFGDRKDYQEWKRSTPKFFPKIF